MRARQTAPGVPNQWFVGVHAVKGANLFGENSAKFDRIHSITEARGGFGTKRDDPSFFNWFNNQEARDAARAAFGPRGFNCGDASHFVRDCPSPYMIMSKLILPSEGAGTALEVKERWGRIQRHMVQ